jgi:phosphoribosylamine--glycine ligase
LAAGLVDAFQVCGFPIFGPTRAAAQIESSKAFAKRIMFDAGVPTAACRICSNYDDARSYVREHGAPIVVKASGLALGKGAYVCKTIQEAEVALNELMVRRVHGDAGDTVILEDFLEGPEISGHAFCDGTSFSLFPSAQDHKPALDGDLGKNTGGMGTLAPVPWVSEDTMQQVGKRIVSPILAHLFISSTPFVGCLYPGLKVTPNGLAVLEFNARPGDPEIQSYMRLLKTDLFDIVEACVQGKLSQLKVEWSPGVAVCIVLASGGYPDAYKKGLPISGIQEAEKVPGVVVFHAGTTMSDGALKTSGGRVLGVTAVGPDLAVARDLAYAAVERISFEGKQFRRDIGAKSLAMPRLMIVT